MEIGNHLGNVDDLTLSSYALSDIECNIVEVDDLLIRESSARGVWQTTSHTTPP